MGIQTGLLKELFNKTTQNNSKRQTRPFAVTKVALYEDI